MKVSRAVEIRKLPCCYDNMVIIARTKYITIFAVVRSIKCMFGMMALQGNGDQRHKLLPW